MTQSCRLYVITPSEFELESFAAELQEALSGGDVACVQLRMKDAPRDNIVKAVLRLMPICHDREVQFIINDDPELAVELDADGVHVGDEDVTAAEARAIVGAHRVVGVSCYASKDRAYDAGEQDADYVAFGQFYETKTKPPKGRPGTDLLEFWRDYTTLPSVAIGGIKPENCAPLVKAGADFLAVLTGVWDYPDGPRAAVRAYNDAIQKAVSE